MDTKLMDNDVVKNSKARNLKNILLLFLLIFIVSSFIVSFFYNKAINFSLKTTKNKIIESIMLEDDYYLEYSHVNREEFLRYAKNISRFFTYYNGYDFLQYSDDDIYNFYINEEQINLDLNNLFNEYLYSKGLIEKNTDTGFQSKDFGIDSLFRGYIYRDMIESDNNIVNDFYIDYFDSIILAIDNNKTTTIIESKINYYDIKNYIEEHDYLKYYLINSENVFKSENVFDETETKENMLKYIKEESYRYMSLDNNLFISNIFNNETISTSFTKNGFTGYLFVPSSTENDYIKDLTVSIDTINSYNNSMKIINFLSIVLFICLISFLTYKNKFYLLKDGINLLNKIYFHIPLFLKLIFLYLGILKLKNIFVIYFQNSYLNSDTLKNFVFSLEKFYVDIFYLVICFVSVFLFVYYIFYCIKNPSKVKGVLKIVFKFFNSIIYFVKDFYKNLSYIHTNENIFKIFALYLGIVGTVGFFIIFLFSILYRLQFFTLTLFTTIALTFIAFLICLYYVFVLLNSVKLSHYIKQIYLGEKINISENTLKDKDFYFLNNIQEGFNDSIIQAIKSERMKSDLITNVSHDLKTPLTSIINYTELLKKEGTNSINAPEYLNILSTKSERLKLLIEDLFEASKLSSGNIKLEKENINIIDLLNQTLGELSEKIKESELYFIINSPEELILNIDGNKMWRVFDNLINNIIKYSLKGTRAYIDLEQRNNKTKIIFKNISAYEIDFNPIELMDRFKRADSSRSTEGNGLGLSIAQSIVELHNGTLEIITDGDLFKIIITL